MSKKVLLLFLLVFFANPAFSQKLNLKEALKDQGIIWGMVFLNKDELLFTEREGFLKKLNLKTKKLTPLDLKIPELYVGGQGGLLDLALHPEFQKNRLIYLTCSIKLKKGLKTTALVRGKLEGNKVRDLKILFKAQDFYKTSHHFGSRIVFDDKGHLFMTVGDRGKKKKAQDLNSHLGKLLRMDEEGRALKDNPFFKRKGAKKEIYTYGHRNPQGLDIHPETRKIYLQEHGPRGGDELNLIKRGRNYGWPVVTFGRAYSGLKIGEGTHKKGMEAPLKHWTPSIAPSGLMIYSGKKFKSLRGDVFSGALVLRHVSKLKITKKGLVKEKRLFEDLSERFRSVVESPSGEIFFGTDSGKILKLSQ